MKYLSLLVTFASFSAFTQNLVLEGSAEIKPKVIETLESCSGTDGIPILDTPSVSLQLRENHFIDDQNTNTFKRNEGANYPPEFVTFFPSFFTPDGDGVKDVFRVVGAQPKQYHCRIFNRWGELFFESKDISIPWDGTSNGKFCKQDSYIWICSYTGLDKKEVELSGTIVLFR